jgi:hypothetical protein
MRLASLVRVRATLAVRATNRAIPRCPTESAAQARMALKHATRRHAREPGLVKGYKCESPAFYLRRGAHQGIVEFLLIGHNGLDHLREVGAILSGRGIAGDDRCDRVYKGCTVDVGDIEEA